jgi:putative sugar O-methyltransferase
MNADKISQAYKNSVENYEEIQKSKHWQDEYGSRDVDLSIESLFNFRNNSLVDGLNRSIDSLDSKYIKNHFNQLTKKCSYDFVYDNLDQLNIGNNKNFIKYRGRFVSVGDNFHIKFLYDLDNHVFKAENEIKVVCEIGGGYGNLSKLVRKRYSTTMILIDLPESNLMSTYYLYKNFPNANFFIDHKGLEEVNLKTIRENDFIIIPPWTKFSSKIKIDLFINTRSMMEMNYSVIKDYFLFIQKHINDKGFFYNVNKYYKDTVGHPIVLDKYPYDNNWSVIASHPSWMQESKIHMLLTKRGCSDHGYSLKLEMKRIWFKKVVYLLKRKIDANPLLLKLIRKFTR